MRQFLRFLMWMAALAVVGAIVVALGARFMVGRSLPVVDGTVTLTGLATPVTIARDALGIPTIMAGSRVDLARAMGFLHVRSAFFRWICSGASRPVNSRLWSGLRP